MEIPGFYVTILGLSLWTLTIGQPWRRCGYGGAIVVSSTKWDTRGSHNSHRVADKMEHKLLDMKFTVTSLRKNEHFYQVPWSLSAISQETTYLTSIQSVIGGGLAMSPSSKARPRLVTKYLMSISIHSNMTATCSTETPAFQRFKTPLVRRCYEALFPP